MRFSLILIALLVLLSACNSKSERLVGSWVSEPTNTEWGKVIIKFDFRSDGTLDSMINSVDGGEGLSRHGIYSVKSGRLVSDMMGRGEPVKFWFDGADLIIATATDPPRRFKRP